MFVVILGFKYPSQKWNLNEQSTENEKKNVRFHHTKSRGLLRPPVAVGSGRRSRTLSIYPSLSTQLNSKVLLRAIAGERENPPILFPFLAFLSLF